jgi:DNA segregation ATPase FtsK/SpoIIIE-like protein
MEMVGHKESGPIMDKIKQIVMLGRQSGFFLILACQRPDAKYLQDGSRDQFNFRVALGKLSEQGYSMIFGDAKKEFVSKTIRGRGYVDVGENVISEFYTPLVPAGYDFLGEIGKYTSLPESNTVLFEDEA